jgi:OFA family oxalate/formate antiporter-like MFS transporter
MQGLTAIQRRLRADWPFPAGNTPFFYGWVIAVLSTLGFLFSVPGQTMGMAVFADAFIEATGLSRTELSFAYMLGTITSALFLTRAGRFYDHYGPRIVLVGASLMLGTAVGFISVVDVLSQALAERFFGSPIILAFGLMTLAYFGVRFSGQGIMTSASGNMLLMWFERNRGLVSGSRGVLVSLGFSLAPLGLAMLIDSWGWRQALWWLAIVVGPVFAMICLVLIRDNPQVCGLNADNLATSNSSERVANHQTSYTLQQVRKNPVFWLYSMGLSIHALFGTAVTFHIVAIFEQAGRSRAEAFAYFIPQALVSVVVNLSASALADYMRLKPLMLVMLLSFIAGAIGLIFLQSDVGYWTLVLGFGVGGGLWGTLSNLVFIRHYGPKHLGEISGLNAALTVFASAIGPLLFSLAFDRTGTFAAGPLMCIAALVALFVVCLFVPQPLDTPPSR